MKENTLEGLPMVEKPGLGRWLFDPFAYVAGGTSLCIGLVMILLSGLLGSLSNSHFDGVLDFHTAHPMPLWFFLTEGFVDWLSLAVFLLIAGKFVSKSKFRAIDVLGTQAMARWPGIISALLALLPPFQNFSRYLLSKVTQGAPKVVVQPTDGAIFMMAVGAMLLALCWMVWLMYRAFSVSCNMKGGKAIATFIASLLVAEIISKVVILALAGFVVT